MNWQLLAQFWWLIFPAAFLAVGSLGLLIDADHRKNLAWRRGNVGHVFVTDLKTFPGLDGRYASQLVGGEVVLAVNRLLYFIARFRLFFGGEVKTFHDLMTRARQEATLRMIEQAADRGYDAVGNVRLEFVDVRGTTINPDNNRTGVYVGIIAYGTAYKRLDGSYPPPAPPTLTVAPS